MVNPDHIFHIADYVIFGATIAISLGIGLYYALSGGKQRTTSEYFVGNRQMTIIPVAISLMVSFESSIMMLGTPAEVYVYGFQWLIGNVGYFIANILSIIIVVPLIHPLRITSAYEYLEMRFESRHVRTLGTLIGMLSYSCYMGIVLFGPAIALEAVTGFPQWTSIFSVALASVIYTAIGGLKAVIWTDVFQCVVMFTGFFAVLIKGTMRIGGVGKTWEIAIDKGRLNLFNFDTDPTIRHTFWNLFVGSIIRGFGLVFNQSSIQRISSTPTIRDARKVLMLVAPGFFLSLTLAGIEGIIAYAYYDVIGCDPLKSKQITNPNQIVPYMVMDIFQGFKGMPGLFMASLFSASLSTLSSGLSSLSALFWTDLVKPHTKPMSEFKATVISKLSVVAFGGLAVFVAFMIALVGGTLVQIAGSILSAFGGPLTGLFMLGIFCPWANAKGAIGGTVLSMGITFFLCIGQMTTKGSIKNTKLPSAPIDQCPAANVASMIMNVTSSYLNTTSDYENVTSTSFMTPDTTAFVASGYPEPTGFSRIFMISYQWFGAIGIMQVIIYGTIISLCTGYKKPGEVKKKFLIPFYDSLFPFLPECIRKPLRCGYEYPDDDEEDDKKSTTDYQMLDGIKPFLHEAIDINYPVNIQQKANGTSALNSSKTNVNGDVKYGNDVINTTKAEVTTSNAVNIAKSVDNISASVRLPVRDIEMNIMRADSQRGSAGFVTVENSDQLMPLQLRAKSLEFDIEK
ncbi:sodium-dependent multivitamin transporter-like [Mya arenaria]|uniref:sodium-dependent multivitamin transporter-like n=1 Tax=Mya arenaria TaxID=6604 RepID=UPI0022E2E769|nr:sodium-dependent multivitamin transporter-like [Mya arenaria]